LSAPHCPHSGEQCPDDECEPGQRPDSADQLTSALGELLLLGVGGVVGRLDVWILKHLIGGQHAAEKDHCDHDGDKYATHVCVCDSSGNGHKRPDAVVYWRIRIRCTTPITSAAISTSRTIGTSSIAFANPSVTLAELAFS